jgi:predicted DNA binding CopG/RHH family protein
MSNNKITINDSIEFEVTDHLCDLIIEMCEDEKRCIDESDKSIEIELSDEDFTLIAKHAHEENITFNQMVNNILYEQLNKLKEDN